VLVEDKPEILTAVKRALGTRVTTVLVRQGKYGQAPLPNEAPPDLVFDSISALAESDFSRLDPALSETAVLTVSPTALT
jgi:hypothetical protein